MRSGARGNARGRRARRKNHTPSVLVQKETTIEAKLRHRGLPHTNNMQTLGKLLDLCHEPSTESPFSPRRR